MENKTEITDPAISVQQNDAGEEVYIFPATPAQNRFWLLDQLAPGDPALNIPLAARLKGQLDRTLLEQSINELIDRHEALRTTFRTLDGEVVQVIHAKLPASLEWQDASDLPESELEARVGELLIKEAGKGLVISTGPVFRAGIIELRKDWHVLYLTAHHIVCDGWSSGVILRELAEIYTALASGKPVLPELPLQYADFSQWQLEWLKSPDAERSRKFWSEMLQGIPPVLNLPTDYPRKPGRRQPSEIRTLLLPVSLTDSIKSLSTREDMTPFMLYFAAYATVLYRYTGSRHFIIGTPAANRKQTNLEGVVGLFSNPLALKLDFSRNPTMRSLLLRVKDLALGAFDHQSYPFEKLLERIPANPARTGLPWLQTYFIFQKAFLHPQQMPGLSLEPMRSASPGAMFEWSLAVLERAEGIRLQLEFNKNLFEEDSIDRVLKQFQHVLELMLSDLNVKVDELPILTPPEWQRQLVDWNSNYQPITPDQRIHELLERQAAATPQASAIRSGDMQITYQQLNRRVNRLAGILRRRGVKEREKVGLLADGNSLDYCVGFLAILKVGGCCVILDPFRTEAELLSLIQRSGVVALMGKSNMPAAILSAARQNIFLDKLKNDANGESDENIACPSQPEDAACVRFSSGRCGEVKGAIISHRALVNATVAAGHALGIRATDVVAMSAEEMLPSLLAGAELSLPDHPLGLSLEKWLEWVTGGGITIASLPTALWSEILRTCARKNKLDSGKLRLLALGGSPIPPAALKIWQQLAPASIRLIDRYMLAETAGAFAFSEPLSNANKMSRVSIARPALNSQLYVLDKNLQPVAAGVPGDVYLGGESLTLGYVGSTATGDDDFIVNPFRNRTDDRLFNTGDRGRFLADQGIELVGRQEDLAKTKGYRLELWEIRKVLSEDCRVWDVVLEPGVGPESTMAAHVLTAPGEAVESSELINSLRERLPTYMVPEEIIIWTEFPRMWNGSVDLKALARAPLRDKTWRGSKSKGLGEPVTSPPLALARQAPLLPGGQYAANGWHKIKARHGISEELAVATSNERALAEIWCDVLGLKQIGLRDNFFEIGGHSLVAMRLVSEINRKLKQNLPVRLLFQSSTISELARHISVPELNKPKLEPVHLRKPELIQLKDGNSDFELIFVIDEGSLGLFKLAHFMKQDQQIYASVVPMSEQALKTSAEKRIADLPSMSALAADHVALILSHKTKRPIVLAGHCFSGLLAFEVAHQLRQAGKPVEMVMMMDTWMTRSIPWWWRKKTWLQAHWQKFRQQGAGYFWRKSRRRINLEKDELAARLKLMTDRDFSVHVPWTIIQRIYRHASRGYRPPEVLSSRGVLFISGNDWQSNAYRKIDNSLGANRWFTQPAVVVDVPGDHVTVLDEQNLPELAQCYDQTLAKLLAK